MGVSTSSSAQYAAPQAYAPPLPQSYISNTANAASALNSWRNLRQSSGYRFADYARFLIPNRNWPDERKMRGWAERAMQPGEHGPTVIAFFAAEKPRSGNGWARLADAYAGSGRAAEALDAARNAWFSADLSGADEQGIWARFGNSLARADHDRRVDSLLFARKSSDAARLLAMASPNRQAAFAARVAMQNNAADAEQRYQSVIGSVTRDAGLMMDRARYLRGRNFSASAQQLLARDRAFVHRPADPARFYEMQVTLAQEAASEGKWPTAYHIARQIDDVLPGGARVADQPIGIRDDYTTLAWLAGTTALDRMNQPVAAVANFERYAQGGRSLQVQSKGYYWAGRASLAAGRYQPATAHFQRAAAYPELFYGQLALERLGRSVVPPAAALTQYSTTPLQRSAFSNRSVVQATRLLGQQGRPVEQALFIRALAESLDNDVDRNLAVEFGQQIGRQDLGVWTARMARVKGSMFYVRQAFPSLPGSLSGTMWPLAHGIARQESSFDPYALSHAGARGMMQLMPGTAREQAGKMGLSYDSQRLMTDPAYNVMLGSAYFQRMLNTWDGNVPLAVASYNAGAGNVRKWVNRYGDPRRGVDILKWIEAIPFSETKAYVQRVVENSVVYDSMRSPQPQQSALHVSRYLGKNRPG